MTLYLDLCFLLNFAADFFLICLTGKASGLHSKLPRVIGACTISAVCSCISEICSSRFPELIFLFILPIIMLFICFGKKSPSKYIEAHIILWGSSFLLGGITTVMMNRLGHLISPGMFFGVVLFVMFFCFLYFDIFSSSKDIRSVELSVASKKRTEKLSLLCDSGNLVKEPISGLPVIIVSSRIFDKLFPESKFPDPMTAAGIGLRILPIKTATGDTLSVAAKADSATLVTDGKHESDITELMLIGRAKQDSFGGFDGIFPSSLL